MSRLQLAGHMSGLRGSWHKVTTDEAQVEVCQFPSEIFPLAAIVRKIASWLELV